MFFFQHRNIRLQFSQLIAIQMMIVHLIEHAEMSVAWIHVIIQAHAAVELFAIQKIIKEFANAQPDSPEAHWLAVFHVSLQLLSNRFILNMVSCSKNPLNIWNFLTLFKILFPAPEITVGCKSSESCTLSESCVNELCTSPCNCGVDAECHVQNHHPVCVCKPGFSGNPQYGCFKLECQSNDDCTDDKTCFNNECINPCVLSDPCAVNAECFGLRHQTACRCLSGYKGSPFERCERLECSSDYECPGDRACINNHCVNPCEQSSPCAPNAVCFVRNHAANCKCPDTLPNGNPLSYCEQPRVATGPECRYDDDCPSKLACIREKCVEPCRELSPCAPSARCSVLDSSPVRTMVCECPELFVPDENGECRRIVIPTPPGCKQDTDCPSDESCINRQCKSPCDCGPQSTCLVKDHRAICSCLPGYVGNPNIMCRSVGCRSDSECDSGHACINGNCVNPCVVESPCGLNAECYVAGSRPECRCLSGYRGNPFEICRAIECRSNSDCPGDKACENAVCVNPCVYDNVCSPRAECSPQNHMPVCKCPEGYIGNPYVDCKPEPQVECTVDADCPARLACINNECINPCTALEPCIQPSKCEVVPSLPVRTMICICPDGYVSSGNGTCKPMDAVIPVGCVSDSDCPSEKACVNDICRDPCACAPNAVCRVKDHKPICSCEQGYYGQPEIQCIHIGCRSDDECSTTHACINRQCVPVCAGDGSSCGERSECYGINHNAVCECKPGYVGNPKVGCEVIGCRSDSECPTDKACINQKCESPCDQVTICERDEVCRVYSHKPQCSCPPGTVSQADGSCRAFDELCKSDNDCPSQLACINSQCINPCTATEPCGGKCLWILTLFRLSFRNSSLIISIFLQLMPNVRFSTRYQYEPWFVCVLKAIKEMLLFNVIRVSFYIWRSLNFRLITVEWN